MKKQKQYTFYDGYSKLLDRIFEKEVQSFLEQSQKCNPSNPPKNHIKIKEKCFR